MLKKLIAVVHFSKSEMYHKQSLLASQKKGKKMIDTQTTKPQDYTDTLFNGELLTLQEAATLLKVTRKTLYAWKRAGKIRTVKIAGSLVRIPRADLANLITA